MRRPAWNALSLVAVVAVLGGCGKQPRSAALPRSQIAAELQGSPRPLAELHKQANRLLPSNPRAFRALLATLRGYPVVVNEWASWCTNCEFEAPDFQRMAVKYGARVAFIGLDVDDAHGAAAAFLHRFPVTYPSYVDPRQSVARSLLASGYYPQTIYLDRRGRLVIDNAGSYKNLDALQRDIRRYALQ
jgi:cytochrome c biogenesis protein CcmG/thiol:disulfide interchange protein DsbE